MVQKTRLASLLGLGSVLLLSGIAHAQTSSASSGGPGGAPQSSPYGGAPSSGSYGAASDGGVVNNQSATTDGSTITSSSTDTYATEDSTLANTGGEPWMMAFAGLTLAAGALTLRRRIN